jgi:hypothetical protein
MLLKLATIYRNNFPRKRFNFFFIFVETLLIQKIKKQFFA